MSKTRRQDDFGHSQRQQSDLEDFSDKTKTLPGRQHVVKLPRHLDHRTLHSPAKQDKLKESMISPGDLGVRPFMHAHPGPSIEHRTPSTTYFDPAAPTPRFGARAHILNAILSPRVEISSYRERYFDSAGKNPFVSGIVHTEFNPSILATCQERSAGRAPTFRDPVFKSSLSPRRW
jgi:hypothetical protein